ncbi:hypothetical protein HBI56_177080 [Parastagonospora nodorum]|nr:hypothetical protein HBH53_249810 [Parastagonospora nodorum]KAH4003970.1 hypothetical protein HBI10_054960 [Parastagonospora nodorum]KAH4017121.1 hypothetical protein HBI13_147780 [Parastagonospora nodorum]KAH4038199.1 hypothetical protein HBI09_048170 [Parastagonospora nodorum]KAH4055234.1 hypothetical protein HBH49_056570 [Parastagonospora nodorum]
MSTLPTIEDIIKWPAPNYVNPETRRPLVFGVEIPLTILTIVFTAGRFYSRTIIVKALGWDDWFMLAATIISTATNIMICISTLPAYQTGYHLYDLRPEILVNPYQSAQMAMACQLLYIPVCVFTKISLLITYLRIFPSRSNKWFCYILMVYEVGWGIAAFFATLFQCSPIQSYWLIQSPVRNCGSTPALYYSTSSLNIFTDFLIFLWPAKDLASVQISVRQRITLITMFCLGVIICIAGLLRVWYVSIYLKSWDFLWHGTVLFVIVSIETSIGIICGCLPGCKPLFTRLFPSIFSHSANSNSYSRSRNKTPQHPPNKSVDGQSFPFQIVKEEGFEVRYGNNDDFDSRGNSSKMGTSSTTTGKLSKSIDDDGASDDSREWIMMQNNPVSKVSPV